jgi:hypothetical protein
MARWRLITAHYLSVEGNSWEQVETDRMTGKQLRKRVEVPMLLDIADQSLWNGNILRNPRGEILGGDIIVALKGSTKESTDYVFTGEPTPDMFPIDSEAEAISAKLEKKWKAAPNEDKTYGQQVMENVQEEQAKLQAAANVTKIEGLDEVLKSMTALLTQNQALIATLTSTGRRV